jgi:hypothetical protein
MPEEKRKERENSALTLQKKLTTTVTIISNYAHKLYAEAEVSGLHKKKENKELFTFIYNLKSLTFKSMIDGLKKGQVPFLYEK